MSTMAVIAVCLSVSIANATPVTDWVDGLEKKLDNAAAITERSKAARCGMQTDKQAHAECVQAFDVAKIYGDALKEDLKHLLKIDTIANPVLRQEAMDAAVDAYNDSLQALTKRLRSIENIFKQVISSARP